MKRVTLLIVLVLALFSVNVNADQFSERENLAKLIKELDYFIQRVDTISHDAPKVQPYFRYDLLKEDMKTIRAGINEYYTKSLTVARDIKPLNAHYMTNNH